VPVIRANAGAVASTRRRHQGWRGRRTVEERLHHFEMLLGRRIAAISCQLALRVGRGRDLFVRCCETEFLAHGSRKGQSEKNDPTTTTSYRTCKIWQPAKTNVNTGEPTYLYILVETLERTLPTLNKIKTADVPTLGKEKRTLRNVRRGENVSIYCSTLNHSERRLSRKKRL